MIRLKNKNDIEQLRISGSILARTHSKLRSRIKEGVFLRDLDVLAREEIEKLGAIPAFLNYKPAGASWPYPASICASVNETVVHGLPGDYIIRKGDVLKVDAGVNYKGYITDSAFTVGIGRIPSRIERLIKITRRSLEKAIKLCKAGNHLGDIGWIIEKTVEEAGFEVIKKLTGHGVGFDLHEYPNVPNYGQKGMGLMIQPGMVLAIEPMTSAGSGDVKQIKDNSFVTADGSVSVHFEHTIAVTKKGPEILTKL